jgi:hypothetical protein
MKMKINWWLIALMISFGFTAAAILGGCGGRGQPMGEGIWQAVPRR